MNHPLVLLTLSRFRMFFREPAAVFWVYGFPLLLAGALGFAFQSRPVERVPVDVSTDGFGGAAAAADLQAKLQRDPRITVTAGSDRACRDRLRTAKTGIVVVPTSGPNRYDYVFDPNRPESVLARSAADNALLRADNPAAATPTDVPFDEPGGRYIDFLLPGLLGVNLMGGGLWGVGFVTVDMRVRKLLKRFLATPMRKRDFLLALMLSRIAFTIIEVLLLLAFGWLVFGVEVRGNPLALAALIGLGAACFGGVGLLVACRAATIETVSGLMNAVMLPMYVVGGVFFPATTFPDAVQPVIQALPLTALLNGLRAVMNEGAGWDATAGPAAILVAWGGVSFVLALRWFRWR